MSGRVRQRLRLGALRLTFLAAACGLLIGCAAPAGPSAPAARPNVAPDTPASPGAVLKLSSGDVHAMYRELVPIDLPSVVRVSTAQNPEIRQARQVVEASRGRFESAVGGAFPALVPTALFDYFEGTTRAVNGALVGAGFNTFQMSLAVQWIINPGRVAYEIIAAKRRLRAAEHQEQAVVLSTLQRALLQYFELALAQARVSAAHQSEAEADELLRITKLRVAAGTGVSADELRAQARLAQRRQDSVLALKAFFDASVALSLTLEMDLTVTLVPAADELPEITLVRPELPIEELLSIAVQYRPDLASVRALVQAAAADRGAAWWGNFGPQFQVGYQYGGITGHSNNTEPAQGIPNNLIVNPFSQNGSFSSVPIVNGGIKELISRASQRLEGPSDQTFAFHDQSRAAAGAGGRLSVSAFGDLKSASANQSLVETEAQQRLDEVCAQVVSAQQASRANHELIHLAQQELASADEALRRTQANLSAGTMTTLDVLESETELAQARLRYADAVIHYNQAEITLLASVGLLAENSLAPPK